MPQNHITDLAGANMSHYFGTSRRPNLAPRLRLGHCCAFLVAWLTCMGRRDSLFSQGFTNRG
jgi:hypothetical protein